LFTIGGQGSRLQGYGFRGFMKKKNISSHGKGSRPLRLQGYRAKGTAQSAVSSLDCFFFSLAVFILAVFILGRASLFLAFILSPVLYL
jgi:hypothetical protein